MSDPVDWTGIREIHARRDAAERQAAFRKRRDTRHAAATEALNNIAKLLEGNTKRLALEILEQVEKGLRG